MIRPRTFYVYAHYRKAGDESPFYIGKGSWSPKKVYGRSYSEENRNIIWCRTVQKAGGFVAVVIADFFSEADAFAFESALISEHGRADRAGALVNLTDGGEGGIGRIVKPETIDRWRKTMEGRPHRHAGTGPMLGLRHRPESREAIACASRGENNPMFGTRHSEIARAKMSAAVRKNHARSRPVMDEATGVVYPSAREAARQLGLNPGHLKNWLGGRQINKSTLRWA